MNTAVILAGGDPPETVGDLPADAVVIAADSGLDTAVRLGVAVDVVIGDLDSVSPAAMAAAGDGATVRRHPVDKDATDLELAFEHARSLGVRSVVLIGGGGGRIDHFFANASLVASQTGLDVEWRTGHGVVHRVNGHLRLHGEPEETASLLPFGGTARVWTSGFRWTLNGDVLRPGRTRGVSNRFVGGLATIDVTEGDLLVVLPARLGPRPH
jgi:thiamine pyrophosphokinase